MDAFYVTEGQMRVLFSLGAKYGDFFLFLGCGGDWRQGRGFCLCQHVCWRNLVVI